jgi:heptaprenyl diphosphate synthase
MGISRTRHFTYLAMLAAMAIALNMLEWAIMPPLFGLFRVGFANIVALVTIRMLGVKDMIIVNVMRVVIGSLLSGKFLGSTFWISAGGVTLSSLMLVLLDHFHSSLLFTSVISSIAHSAGQIMVVMAFYMQPGILALLPYFLLVSIPTGLLTGTIARLVLKRVKPLRRDMWWLDENKESFV